MELKQLCEKTMKLFDIKSIDELSDKLIETCLSQNCNEIFYKFSEIIENDLSVDWLQMIFQYYQADRKEKKQDYTPKTLAKMVSKLTGSPEIVIDLCAGSGALAIQKWNEFNNQKFKLYEIDSNVIPYLLFNMALRNIECDIFRADALQNEVYAQYSIHKGEIYGKVVKIK